MPNHRPDYRVTRTDGDTGRRSTVGRHITGEAAAAARLDHRQNLTRGSSDDITVHQIHHRDQADAVDRTDEATLTRPQVETKEDAHETQPPTLTLDDQ